MCDLPWSFLHGLEQHVRRAERGFEVQGVTDFGAEFLLMNWRPVNRQDYTLASPHRLPHVGVSPADRAQLRDRLVSAEPLHEPEQVDHLPVLAAGARHVEHALVPSHVPQPLSLPSFPA